MGDRWLDEVREVAYDLFVPKPKPKKTNNPNLPKAPREYNRKPIDR